MQHQQHGSGEDRRQCSPTLEARQETKAEECSEAKKGAEVEERKGKGKGSEGRRRVGKALGCSLAKRSSFFKLTMAGSLLSSGVAMRGVKHQKT